MSKANKKLLLAATEAIDALFSDTSVSRDTCRENLDELREDIGQKLSCLNADDEKESND